MGKKLVTYAGNEARDICERLAEENKRQKEVNRRLTKIIDEKRAEQLLELRRQLWNIEVSTNYASFFNQCVRPFQMIMGYARMDKIEPAMIDEVVSSLKKEIRKSGGSFCGNRFILPQESRKFDFEKAREEIRILDKKQIRNYMEITKNKVKSGQIIIRERNLIEEIGSILEILTEFTDFKDAKIQDQRLFLRMAVRIREVFENNEIYPMFYDDGRLKTSPELLNRFIPSGESGVKYPGLFICGKNGFEILGAHVGTR